jgi:hypothetical protein
MYFFDLEWPRLQPLAAGVPALLADFDSAVDALSCAARRLSSSAPEQRAHDAAQRCGSVAAERRWALVLDPI